MIFYFHFLEKLNLYKVFTTQNMDKEQDSKLIEIIRQDDLIKFKKYIIDQNSHEIAQLCEFYMEWFFAGKKEVFQCLEYLTNEESVSLGNIYDESEWNFLHHAICYGTLSGCFLLVEKCNFGIREINHRDCAGRTPLLLALAEKNIHMKDIVEFLVHNGADVTEINNSGENVFHEFFSGWWWSDEYKDEYASILKFLLKFGADDTLKDKKGRSVMYCAIKKYKSKSRKTELKEILDFLFYIFF